MTAGCARCGHRLIDHEHYHHREYCGLCPCPHPPSILWRTLNRLRGKR